MNIKRIKLKNFRNFKDNEFIFSKINIIIGLNGVGKSNLIEAVYFLGNGYSPRLIKTENIVTWGERFFYIKGEVEKREGIIEIEISYENKKIIKINGKKIQKKIELMNKIPVLIFFPSLVDFLYSTPSRRRYFLDREISKISILYYFNLIKFFGLLKRRNLLLKKIRNGYKEDFLDTIDIQLKRLIIHIVDERLKFVKELNKWLLFFGEMFGFSNLQIKYDTHIKSEDDFNKLFISERKKDIEKGFTQKGPHRDDLNFILDGYNSKIFASQGEKKLIVLLIIFSLWKMMESKGISPILLIDEFKAEFDEEKVKILSNIIGNSKTQIFITSLTDIEYIREKKVVKL